MPKHEIIINRLKYLREEGNDLVDAVLGARSLLEDADIDAEITGREKTRYSIWKKMRKNVAFEQLSDIMAFRIMFDPEDCYMALVYSREVS